MIKCIKNNFGTIDQTIEIGPSIWPHFDLIFVHSGQILLKLINDKSVELSAKECILIYPKTYFQGYTITKTAKISVHHFSFNNLDDLPDIPQNVTNTYSVFRTYETIYLEQDIERLVNLAHTNHSAMKNKIRPILMTLVLSQLKPDTVPEKTNKSLSPEFKNLISWLKENIDKNITLDDMADFLNFSTSHFRAVFKKQTGISPGNYLLNMRINEAAKLLRETLIPIKKVAKITGYRDLTYFYHTFQKYHKVTPKIYRKKHLPLG